MTGCEDFREFFVAFGEWCEMADFEEDYKAMKDPEEMLEVFMKDCN